MMQHVLLFLPSPSPLQIAYLLDWFPFKRLTTFCFSKSVLFARKISIQEVRSNRQPWALRCFADREKMHIWWYL